MEREQTNQDISFTVTQEKKQEIDEWNFIVRGQFDVSL